MELIWFAFKSLGFAVGWSFAMGVVAMILMVPFSPLESALAQSGGRKTYLALAALLAFVLSTTQGALMAEAVMQSRGRPVDPATTLWALVGLVFVVPIAMGDWYASGSTRGKSVHMGLYGGLVGYVVIMANPELLPPVGEWIARLVAVPPQG